MATASGLEFFLVVLKPVTVFSGRVNGAPVDPFVSLTWDAGATGTASAVGTSGAPVAGNSLWIGSSVGGRERGLVRLRDWTPSDPTGTVGTLKIAETDDTGPLIADNDYLTAKLEWRLWPRVPRIVSDDPNSIEYYEDYDLGYSDQTIDWLPVAVPGPPAVEFLAGGVAQVSFVGNRSFALAPGATLSSYLWTAHGSAEGTSSSAGTEVSPVTFTWSAAGQYLVSLRVTDSNSKTHTSYTWAFIINPASPTDVAYTQFDAINDTLDFDQGGGQCSFTVHGTADASQFPQESLVIHACRGTLTTATATWPFRTNVLFVGYVQSNTIRQDYNHNTITFQAVTINGLMKSLACYPVRLEDTDGPRNWTQAHDLTVDRIASFLYHWRSTLSLMTSIRPMNYDAEIKSQDFGPGNIYGQLQNDLVGDAWGRVVSDHQSVLYLLRDYQLMTTSERAAITTRKTLHKGIWLDTVEIDERPDWFKPVRKVKMNGVYYPGNQADPQALFSEAPGDVQGDFGNEGNASGKILTTQSDLNTRCGLAFAREIMRYHSMRAAFINDGSFTTAPQELFPANIESGDNSRGLVWQPNLLPRRIRRRYDHKGGFFISEVEFEPSATGAAGVTVDMPAEPPGKDDGFKRPQYDPPVTPPVWAPPVIPVPGAAVASDLTNGVYWTLNSGATWAQRVNGLEKIATGTVSQWAFEDLIWDPWWFTEFRKNTYDPEQVILWGCGRGFVVKSEDAGKNWVDMTSYLGVVANSYDDEPPPSIYDMTFHQMHGDIHQLNKLCMIAEYETGSQSRAWFLTSVDSGFSWNWHPFASFSQDGGAYFYATAVRMWCQGPASGKFWNPHDAGNIPGPDDDLTGYFQKEASGGGCDGVFQHHVTIDFGGPISNIIFGARTRGNLADVFPQVRYSNNASDYNDPGGAGWTNPDAGNPPGANLWYNKDASLTWWDRTGLTIATPYRYVKVKNNGQTADPDGEELHIDAFRAAGTGSFPEVKPLAMDLDNQDGTRLFATSYSSTGGGSGQLYLQRWDISDPDAVAGSTTYDFGSVSEADIDAKTRYAVPYCPAFFDVAGFGDYVYVFGYLPDNGHIQVSTTAAMDTFTEIGSAGWGANRVGGFLAFSTSELYAIINVTGGSQLWQSLNSGSTWVQLNTFPFQVEFEAVSRHAGGRLLVGANTTGPVQGAYLNTPWNTGGYVDATGPAGQRLPGVSGDGGTGVSAIIWVG